MSKTRSKKVSNVRNLWYGINTVKNLSTLNISKIGRLRREMIELAPNDEIGDEVIKSRRGGDK